MMDHDYLAVAGSTCRTYQPAVTSPSDCGNENCGISQGDADTLGLGFAASYQTLSVVIQIDER